MQRARTLTLAHARTHRVNKVLRKSTPSTPSQCSTANCCYGEEKHGFPGYFKENRCYFFPFFFFTAYIRVKPTVIGSIVTTPYGNM